MVSFQARPNFWEVRGERDTALPRQIREEELLAVPRGVKVKVLLIEPPTGSSFVSDLGASAILLALGFSGLRPGLFFLVRFL
ncbi:hypothetical protein AKJ65_05960 [candidate division MSBL1 archaeon SCGC-AAA259E19]|uniref:Uncharacterized protein n=1 Tax=candidate division MSBL1 archaeon SCGC-AAA259E19 TaxID=1698264 RepID=A0A133UHQ4_9EURY|nr:hypothetical protein AKJ65_05960 [candidate division MSBL1 archaeon SCGC-AAA259E19]